MTWSRFWYTKATLAWLLAATGAVTWGEEHRSPYLFVLSVSVALTAVAASRVARDKGRRQAYEAGWEARDTLSSRDADVHQLPMRRG